MVILVAHLNKALRYLPPAKYIPAKKNRCAIIIRIGPPMIVNKGSCQKIERAAINPTPGKLTIKLKQTRKIPKKFLAVGFSLKTLRSAPSLMARLAYSVFAMPPAIFFIMLIK